MFIKKCLNPTKLVKFLNNSKVLLTFFLLFIFQKNSIANECLIKKELNIGLIENNYIDYKYYLYYVLGEYSLINDIEFTISEVNQNANEFDIIFGEFRDLAKLSLNQTQVPNKVLNFYNDNEVEVIGNIFPLDLDTFILLSQDDYEKLNFEEFSELYNPIKYTLGMSFKTKEDIINLIIYHLEQPSINVNSLSFELTADLFSKTYQNLNKNIVNNNFLEVFNSYENSENVYTLFSDGILLNKNIEFSSFQLFPKSKYIWDSDEGVFKKSIDSKPLSFYGFSAYLNNSQGSGLLCYLIGEEVRLKAFRDFNIQLSPLSINEVRGIEDDLPNNYKKILENKNKNVLKPNYSLENKNYDLFSGLIFGKYKYDDIIDNQDYLN